MPALARFEPVYKYPISFIAILAAKFHRLTSAMNYTCIITFVVFFFIREDEENLRLWYGKTPLRRKRHRNADADEVCFKISQ